MAADKSPDASTQPFATEAGAADAHLPPGPPPGRWRTFDRLAVLAFAAALVLPAVLLLARVHVAQVENRPPRQVPALTIGGLLDASWPAGVDGFLTDHLALRPYAIRLRGLAYWLSGGTGNPQVVRGIGDWLFFRDEFQPPCSFSGAQLGASLERSVAGLQARGIDFRFLLIPDKHTVYPEKVRQDLPFGPSCEDAGRAALEAALAQNPTTTIDARAAMLAAHAAAPATELYYPQDTHWTPSGAVVGIAALIRSFGDDLWSDADVVVQGTKRRVTDLSALTGLRHVHVTPKVVIRPQVEQQRVDVPVPVKLANARTVFRITSSGPQTLLPGRTLVIYDSFFGIDTSLVAPFFAETTWVHEGDLTRHPELATLLGPFDRVILERVERGLYTTNIDAALSQLIAGGQ